MDTVYLKFAVPYIALVVLAAFTSCEAIRSRSRFLCKIESQ
jgi:hypothetical protein